jgi:hypothetical protein
MKSLNAEIFPSHGRRVRVADLGDAFPKCQITAELYDLEGAGRIEQLYAEMNEAVLELQDFKTFDKSPDHPLTRLLRARQEIELIKVPLFCELTEDALAQGLHVAHFVNFRQTVDELCKRLRTNCRIDGTQIGAKGFAVREHNACDTEKDQSRSLCAARRQAASVSDLKT